MKTILIDYTTPQVGKFKILNQDEITASGTFELSINHKRQPIIRSITDSDKYPVAEWLKLDSELEFFLLGRHGE